VIYYGALATFIDWGLKGIRREVLKWSVLRATSYTAQQKKKTYSRRKFVKGHG
jgi:hypothetical protein